MLKFFQFSGTISGTTYFLRVLFSIILSLPGSFIYQGYIINYLMDNEIIDFDQSDILANITILFEQIEQNTANIHASFTFEMITILFLAFLPSIWFNLASVYKRISSLFYENRKNIFAFYFGYELIVDSTSLEILPLLKSFTIYFSIISLLIFLFLIFKNSDIDKDDHEG